MEPETVTMTDSNEPPFVDPQIQFANYLVEGVKARFPPLNTARGAYALSVLIKRWPLSILFKHQAVVGTASRLR